MGLTQEHDRRSMWVVRSKSDFRGEDHDGTNTELAGKDTGR